MLKILGSIYMPPEASTVAPQVDWLFNFILGITIFFCVLIFAGMLVFCIKYRHRPGHTGGASPGHSTGLELTWTIIPTIIVLVVFFYGFRGFLDMAVVPPNAYEIIVQSKMWNWAFQYPNGTVTSELHVPKDRPIRIVLTSDDVIHSFYIPAFRTQKMSVPGRYNRAWFQATKLSPPEGFPIYCAQYCGTNHSEMISKVIVEEQTNFDRWLENASNPEKQADFTPAGQGEKLYKARGCAGCHTVDGSHSTGPSWKDMFGSKVSLSDGSTVVAEENYVRDSVLYPSKQIVQGYPAVMPSFLGQLKDKEIGWLIDYMKTVSVHANTTGGEAKPVTAPAHPDAPARSAGSNLK
jgi:cytochrome c oxidase subunit II